MQSSLRVLLLFTVLSAFGCGAPPDPMDEAPPVDLAAEETAVAAVVNDFSRIWEEEDMDLVSRVFARGPSTAVFGTDLAEQWIGYDTFRESLLAQFESYENTEVTVRDQVVTVHPSGQVAWFREIADWHVTAGGQRAEVNDMRVTGVLHKGDMGWRIVQMHVSVPVAGQVVEY